VIRTGAIDREVSVLNIGAVSYRAVPPQQGQIGQGVEPVVHTAKQPAAKAKQAVREAILRQIAEAEAARNAKGEDDPRVRSLLQKFYFGRKLTPDETAYLRRNAPGKIDEIERVMREREVVEQSMRFAPTRLDVQMVAARAMKSAAGPPYSADGALRARHIADAQYEYMKTDEFREKPVGPFDRRPRKTGPYPDKTIQYLTTVVFAYERAKSFAGLPSAGGNRRIR
jgi:hypothetical protein